MSTEEAPGLMSGLAGVVRILTTESSLLLSFFMQSIDANHKKVEHYMYQKV